MSTSKDDSEQNFSFQDAFDALSIAKGELGVQKSEELTVQYRLKSTKFSYIIDLAEKYEETHPELAFHYYQLIFQKDPKKGAGYLGRCFEEGIGVEPSLEKAIECYKIFEQGTKYENLFCQCRLANLYFEGKGVERSLQKARDLLLNVIKKKRSIQIVHTLVDVLEEWYEINTIEQKDLSIEKRLEKLAKIIEEEELAIICLKLAEELGGLEDSYQQVRLGLHYHHLFRFRQAFRLFMKSSDQGCASAQFALGRYFQLGNGCEKSWEEAIKYYQLAADQGNAQAHYELGCCFQQGLGGLERSNTKAIEHFKLSAEQGYPDAQLALAGYLLKNKINEEQAVHYLKLVIQKRQCDRILLAACEYDLGKCYEKGKGIKQSTQNALYYYKAAAKHGDRSAQSRLGDAYLEGELGLKESSEKAIEYYHLAAQQGCSYSLAMIGQCYERGEGVELSPEKAFHYYKLAAEIDIKEGDNASIYGLARCYELGIGTEKCLVKAIHYYKLAGENDFKTGYYKVGCCYKEMGGEENVKNAIAYFKMAAMQGHLWAQLELAEAYKKGLGKAGSYYNLAENRIEKKKTFKMIKCPKLE